MRKPTLLMTSLAAMLALGGCASSLTGDTYSRDEARAVQTVRMGTIESLRPVKITLSILSPKRLESSWTSSYQSAIAFIS